MLLKSAKFSSRRGVSRITPLSVVVNVAAARPESNVHSENHEMSFVWKWSLLCCKQLLQQFTIMNEKPEGEEEGVT